MVGAEKAGEAGETDGPAAESVRQIEIAADRCT